MQAIEVSKKSADAKRVRRVRQPVKPLSLSPEQIVAQTKVEAKRKRASKKALRDAAAPAKPRVAEKTQSQRQAEHEAYVAALRVDAQALGVDPDEYVAQQLDVPTKAKYSGPMLALREAVVRYIKAPNGQPCCGDDLAQICGDYTREQVVVGLIAALELPGNPYIHLNPGQQSMNLRNRARVALKTGRVSIAQVRRALAAA